MILCECSFFSEILRSDMSSEDERELERRIKEFNIIKERERNQIQRQLVLLRTQFERYMQQLEQQVLFSDTSLTLLLSFSFISACSPILIC